MTEEVNMAISQFSHRGGKRRQEKGGKCGERTGEGNRGRWGDRERLRLKT
jgi:hypothetical protein